VGAGATPAIVLSALGSPADVARSRARSFAAHLVKPVEEELLVATIRQVIGGARERGTGGP
jgi:CheY-like chemotaxis protein